MAGEAHAPAAEDIVQCYKDVVPGSRIEDDQFTTYRDGEDHDSQFAYSVMGNSDNLSYLEGHGSTPWAVSSDPSWSRPTTGASGGIGSPGLKSFHSGPPSSHAHSPPPMLSDEPATIAPLNVPAAQDYHGYSAPGIESMSAPPYRQTFEPQSYSSSLYSTSSSGILRPLSATASSYGGGERSRPHTSHSYTGGDFLPAIATSPVTGLRFQSFTPSEPAALSASNGAHNSSVALSDIYNPSSEDITPRAFHESPFPETQSPTSLEPIKIHPISPQAAEPSPTTPFQGSSHQSWIAPINPEPVERNGADGTDNGALQSAESNGSDTPQTEWYQYH